MRTIGVGWLDRVIQPPVLKDRPADGRQQGEDDEGWRCVRIFAVVGDRGHGHQHDATARRHAERSRYNRWHSGPTTFIIKVLITNPTTKKAESAKARA
jgi:hypothetical protein